MKVSSHEYHVLVSDKKAILLVGVTNGPFCFKWYNSFQEAKEAAISDYGVQTENEEPNEGCFPNKATGSTPTHIAWIYSEAVEDPYWVHTVIDDNCNDSSISSPSDCSTRSSFVGVIGESENPAPEFAKMDIFTFNALELLGIMTLNVVKQPAKSTKARPYKYDLDITGLPKGIQKYTLVKTLGHEFRDVLIKEDVNAFTGEPRVRAFMSFAIRPDDVELSNTIRELVVKQIYIGGYKISIEKYMDSE